MSGTAGATTPGYDPTYCFFVSAEELCVDESAQNKLPLPLAYTDTPLSEPLIVSPLSGYPYRVTRRFIEINISNTATRNFQGDYAEPEPQEAPEPKEPAPAPQSKGGAKNNKSKKGGKGGKNNAPKAAEEKPAASAKDDEKDFKDKFRKHKVAADTVDHYEVLGIAHLRWSATASQIRTAYRQMSLQYHPDKMPDGDDSVFKRISRAYEVLSDPQRRKEYDSQDDTFDDRIPSESDAEKNDFFELFTPVFDRNARFSVDKNVPRLGDMDTPFKEVERFYAFWNAFKSWREFPLDDKYDPEDASTREEKRWILRQNEKKAQKKKAEEKARIKRLVALAYKKDPRVIRKMEEEKAERERKRVAKLREAEERAKRAEREREKKEEEKRLAEERARKEKEEKEKAERRNASAITAAFHDKSVTWKTDPVTASETVLGANSAAQIAVLVSKIEGKSAEERHKILTDELDRIALDRKRVQEVMLKEEQEKKERMRQEAEAKKARAPWNDDELALLAKAVRKYPPGTRDRWTKMMDIIRTRTEEEIIEKTQEIKAKSVGHMVANPYERLKEQAKEKEKEAEDGEVVNNNYRY